MEPAFSLWIKRFSYALGAKSDFEVEFRHLFREISHFSIRFPYGAGGDMYLIMSELGYSFGKMARSAETSTSIFLESPKTQPVSRKTKKRRLDWHISDFEIGKQDFFQEINHFSIRFPYGADNDMYTIIWELKYSFGKIVRSVKTTKRILPKIDQIIWIQ